MNVLRLFVDASVDPNAKVGFGAYLIVSDDLRQLDKLKSDIVIRRFENTSSTRLELQTLLWAFGDIGATQQKIRVYTDCQNILSLPRRRASLDQKARVDRNSTKSTMAGLYQQFFRFTDQYECDYVKVEGHKPLTQKDELDMAFSLVDKSCRRALRNFMALSDSP
jgi:hypothetical protein